MAKRSANKPINRENWDEDDDKEEPGTFSRVSEDELKKRIIRKAKRSLTSSSDGTGNSPFAAFSGFGSASNPFSSMKKTDDANSGRSPLVRNNENSTKKENGKTLETAESKSDGNAQQPQKTASSTATGKPARSLEYYRQLQSLNESILRWMQLHLAKNSCCDFTPVFNDYKKHMDTLNVTYPVKKTDHSEEKNSGFKMEISQPEVKSSSFFKSSSNSGDAFTLEDEKSNANSNESSGYKDHARNDDETDYGANFSARTTNTSTFSFGIKCAPTATSSVSPMGPTSSSKEEDKPEKKPFQFTFGVTQKTNDSSASSGFSFASAIAAKNAAGTEDTEEKEYEPPKNEFEPVTEKDALYSKRCKLFFKKGDGFADKGVGTLYLKSIDGKTQLLIRADTSLGNILLNIMLSASLPVSRTGKNNVLLVCVPNPPIDAKNADSKEAIPMLIRVKTSEDADELLENLNKYKS